MDYLDYDIEYMDTIPLFESFGKETLVIVDVQTPFKKWWIKNGKDDLPERINDYCANFSDVYQIWDDHRAKGPTWQFYNEVSALKKHYGVDNPTGDITDYTKVFNPEDIDKAMELGRPGDIAEPWLFKTKDGNYIIRVIGGNHKWFFVSKALYDTMSSISQEIVLVGGAEGECLKDIETLLDILNKKHRTEHKYCYNASDKDVGFGDEDEEIEEDSEDDEPKGEAPTDAIPLYNAKP